MRQSPCPEGANGLVEETGTKFKCSMWRLRAPGLESFPWSPNSMVAFYSQAGHSLAMGVSSSLTSLTSVAALKWLQAPTVVLSSCICSPLRSWSRTGLNLKIWPFVVAVPGAFWQVGYSSLFINVLFYELRTKKKGFCPCSALCHLIQSLLLASLCHAV